VLFGEKPLLLSVATVTFILPLGRILRGRPRNSRPKRARRNTPTKKVTQSSLLRLALARIARASTSRTAATLVPARMTRQRVRARALTRGARARVAALIARHEEKKLETCRSFVRSLASGPARACDAAFRGADGRYQVSSALFVCLRVVVVRYSYKCTLVQFCVTNTVISF
jgi:hypothetical protein